MMIRKLLIGLIGLLCLLVTSCVSTGKPVEDVRYTPHNDLSYGSHERNVIDISIPDAAPEGVILFIHGGIWMYGGKESYPVFLDEFRNRFVVASMSHRYIDATIHMSDLEDDVAGAVAFIREFCMENNVEPGKLIIMGHSSGAHLAMLYAYKQHATSPIPVAFCVDMAGPADLSDVAFLYNFKKMGWEEFFFQLAEKTSGYHVVDGDVTAEGYSEVGKEMLASISPVYFATPESPPTIIVHDVADTIVPYANSAALHSVFNIYGNDHYFMSLYSGIGHLLGAKAIKGGGVRYDKVLETWLVRVMNEYIEKYCR
jgi:acetyl esterase/lipase